MECPVRQCRGPDLRRDRPAPRPRLHKPCDGPTGAGIGFLCLLLGANFLDYSMLSKVLPATDKIMARSHGMLGIEIGVAIAVMAIVISIYLNIVSRGKYDKGL